MAVGDTVELKEPKIPSQLVFVAPMGIFQPDRMSVFDVPEVSGFLKPFTMF